MRRTAVPDHKLSLSVNKDVTTKAPRRGSCCSKCLAMALSILRQLGIAIMLISLVALLAVFIRAIVVEFNLVSLGMS